MYGLGSILRSMICVEAVGSFDSGIGLARQRVGKEALNFWASVRLQQHGKTLVITLSLEAELLEQHL